MGLLAEAGKNLRDFSWCLALELEDFRSLESFTEMHDAWVYDVLCDTLIYSDSEFHYFDFIVSIYLRDPRGQV